MTFQLDLHVQAGEAMGSNAQTSMNVWKAPLAVTTPVSTCQDPIAVNVTTASIWYGSKLDAF